MAAWRTGGTAILAALALAACARRPDAAAVRAALMAADRAFAEASARRGAEGWAASFEADGRQYPARGVLVGTEAIRAAMTRAFGDETSRLVWRPVEAVAAASGDVGYTLGRWETQVLGADGTWTVGGSGNYVTIWRLQGDGRWKVAVDIGNADPPPQPPAGR